MKWCRYQWADRTSYGIIEDEAVIEVLGDPFGDYRVTANRQPLAEVKLLLPVIPGTFYAGGLNYERHIIEASRKYGIEAKLPKAAVIGYRANNALIAHEEDIIKPKDLVGNFEYEGELVAVIGKKVKHVARENALDCIFGWTIGNDISARGWQLEDATFLRSKNSDTFKPMGPWIATDLDPKTLTTTIRLNGKVMDSFDTGNMLFDVATHICTITEHCTLYPGDVIWFGTDGVPENMNVGDLIEVEISGIGTLRNRVIAEQ